MGGVSFASDENSMPDEKSHNQHYGNKATSGGDGASPVIPQVENAVMLVDVEAVQVPFGAG